MNPKSFPMNPKSSPGVSFSENQTIQSVSWAEIEAFVLTIYNRYGQHCFSGVYGLPRGGLTLAVMLSHALGIPLLGAAIPGCLVVDDIADSGESLKHYSRIPNVQIIAYAYKLISVVRPDLYAVEVPVEIWVKFPWEVDFENR